MPIIQRPDLVQKIRKEYELLGPDAIATISPELVPVVIVDDIAERDPDGPNLAAVGYSTCPAAAGSYSSVLLYNPSGSGKDLFLEQFVYAADNAGIYSLRYWNAAPATAGVVINRGLGSLGSPVGQVGYRQDAVPTGAVFLQWRFLGNNGSVPFNPYAHRIPAGEGISVTFETVNVQLRAGFVWTERPVRV